MSARLRFDFWHLQATKGNTSELVSEIMEVCSKLPEDHEDRLLPRDTKVVRLHELEKKGALWFGDFLGIGVRRPAKKASTKGHVEDLPFTDDEGLGEESAFLIDPATNVFILQSNRLAATSSSVVRFFERFTLGRGHLELMPVLSQGGLNQLTNMKNVTSFKVTLAKMDFGHDFSKKKPAVGSMLNIASDFLAPRLTLEVSVGHQWRKKTLAIDKLYQFASDLIGSSEAGDLEVETAQVRGHDEDERNSVLDLIAERLREVVLVEPDQGRGVSRMTRWQKMYEAYSKQEEFLHKHFGRGK